MSFRYQAMADSIYLEDEKGEIIYWDRQEWLDDPDLCVTIAAAIEYGHVHGGEAVRALLGYK